MIDFREKKDDVITLPVKVSTIEIDQLNTYFRHFAGYLTCNNSFCGYKRPRKFKTANIYPHIFEAKTRKFGDAKIFHFRVYHTVSADSFKMMLIATSNLENLRHEKNSDIYARLIETMLLQCRSYNHWRLINIDQTMFQPCMAAEAFSWEFVLRICLLGAFLFHSYLFINRSLTKTIK